MQRPADSIEIRRLGRVDYDEAYALQAETLEAIAAARDRPDASAGVVFVVEHPPVITVSRRASTGGNVLATSDRLAALGVAIRETDRGGDVTYHGPGQLVVYPVLDLNRFRLGLHAYMRTLEESVIRACAGFGLATGRDPGATGVWTLDAGGRPMAKVAAMGVRVRRWVSMHGLSLNVNPDLSHFGLIVPCGLVGRPVTSLERELGERCPTLAAAADAVVGELRGLLSER